MADLGLADAVDAPKALLQPVGVPGQVIVDHQVGALQVDALAGGVGGQQEVDVGIVAEAVLDRPPLRRGARCRGCVTIMSSRPKRVLIRSSR